MRRVPIFATIFVLAAAAVMVGLGVWQLKRLDEKEALLARYAAADGIAAPVAFPLTGEGEEDWFRRSSVDCLRVLAIQPTAGRNADGRSGWAQRASCEVAGSSEPVAVDLGWSRIPAATQWSGGEVAGIVAPGPRLVAGEPPVDTLEPLARPDPSTIPNNHLAYAGQWFFFALTALVIYSLALRRRRSSY
ncbi:MAG: SURF1 family protein [Erythrobacter sp.]|nr:SURF1 family protein [Erythrobacter sp.]